MEAAASRGGSLPVPPPSSQPARKEWRAVSDHPSFRNNGNEDPERIKLGQSDERTIYEEGAGPLGVEFCSITIDGGGGLSEEILQQRLQEISRQREELQRVEIELRAQAIARSEILAMQNSFQSQIKEHADAASQLKGHVEEREQHIHELEMKLEDKDRELRSVRLDNEAAWAKDDLLREQNKELATFRRERDNSEAERAQHLKQIHELQEHIQEKESQLLALEEQHRVAQETILYKDEQLREAQTWIARVQEMDALQSTTIQAELRDRTEQFNQYWIGLQRQFAEVERHHLQTIQQLQLELAETRERSGIHKDGVKSAHQNSADSSSYIQNTGSQINTHDVASSNSNLGFMSNGNLDGHPSYVAPSNVTAKTEHTSGVAVVPTPILGMGGFLPPNQMAALHPFVVHAQGVPQSVPSSSSHIPQSHIGHFQPVPIIPPQQQWQHQQAVPDVSQSPNQSNYQPSQAEQSLLSSDAHYGYELPSERKLVHPDHSSTHTEQQQRSVSVVNGSSNEKEEVLDANSKQYQTSQEPHATSDANALFHTTVGYAQPEQKSEVKDQVTVSVFNRSQEQVQASGLQSLPPVSNLSAASSQLVNSNNATERNEKIMVLSEAALANRIAAPAAPGKAIEPTVLDERTLLACIVRAIPAGADGRIRISTTLPNRLAKMLAPLHWHDYKKHYGKLDDFLAHHPQLFVIEGDFIHLREGAQEIISATTAFAKVAAAASASSSPYSSLFPSVALTPVAQNNRQKMVASTVDSKPPSSLNAGDSRNKRSEIPKGLNQQQNGVNLNVARGMSDMNISAKSNLNEVNGFSSEMRSAHSSVQNVVANGANKGLSNGRLKSGAKPQTRSAGTGVISRR